MKCLKEWTPHSTCDIWQVCRHGFCIGLFHVLLQEKVQIDFPHWFGWGVVCLLTNPYSVLKFKSCIHILCMENSIFQLELTKVNRTEKKKKWEKKKKIPIGRAIRKWWALSLIDWCQIWDGRFYRQVSVSSKKNIACITVVTSYGFMRVRNHMKCTTVHKLCPVSSIIPSIFSFFTVLVTPSSVLRILQYFQVEVNLYLLCKHLFVDGL